ncbi:hypothetical protein NM22_11355 [Vibrio tubiashii]|nr:hypothetical protein NM22_11355 [Vibrio tubiashii]
MYNLSVDEISMVDGGGDGSKSDGFIKSSLKGFIFERGLGYINDFLGGNNNYSDNSGVGIGTNQSYGAYGLDSGGGMMQAGGSRGGYGY